MTKAVTSNSVSKFLTKNDFALADLENFLSEVNSHSLEQTVTLHSVMRERIAESDPLRALAIPNHIYVSDPKRKLDTAIVEEIARIAHFGQVDKIGVDYIEHPRAVARLVETSVPSTQGYDLASAIHVKWAALLHDVVEDTHITIADLFKLGAPDSLLRTINDLTRTRKIKSEDYYTRIERNNPARVVKIADMMHNCDPARLALVDEKTRSYLIKKYSKGIEILTKNYPEDREAFREKTGL